MKASFTFSIALLPALFLFAPAGAWGQTNAVPAFSHIVVVIGENTSSSVVFGSANAPYVNTLAAEGASFTHSLALFHPSQPNYLGLFSGSNQGVTNDSYISTKFITANLGRELMDAFKTYTTFSEGLPSVGFNGNTSGKYVRKHNPAANWMGTGTNQIPTTTNRPFTSFPTNFDSLPSVAFVIPNLCNDGHNLCPPLNNKVKQYDTWVQTNLDAYKQWCITHNSLLIVTYDEDDASMQNQIATVFYGAHVLPGAYSQTINHYNVLRTLEDANGLSTHAGAAATAAPINFCWTPVVTAATDPETAGAGHLLVYPNPFRSTLNISCQLEKDAEVRIDLYDLLGRQVYAGQNAFLEAGPYIFQVPAEELSSQQGLVLIKVSVGGSTWLSRAVQIR